MEYTRFIQNFEVVFVEDFIQHGRIYEVDERGIDVPRHSHCGYNHSYALVYGLLGQEGGYGSDSRTDWSNYYLPYESDSRSHWTDCVMYAKKNDIAISPN